MRWLLALLAVAYSVSLTAQPLHFGYYEVDHLYDTLPSPFYNDTDYTPEGRYRWNTTRYRTKIERLAAVIDSMQLHAVALYGVENESVVRDLAATLEGDYTYFHRTLNTLDGMEFALLYEGDRIVPLRSEIGRQTLYIEALFDCDTVGIVLCHHPATLPYTLTALRERRPTLPLLVAGRLDETNLGPFGLTDRMAAPAARGYGNRRRNSGWTMRHRIATSPTLGNREGQVFLRRELLDEKLERPRATFVGNRYRGGASRSLPIFIEIER